MTYADLQREWKRLRGQTDVTVREIACVGLPRTLLCAEYGNRHAPSVQLSAGVHGDEPAGSLALLQVTQARDLDERFSYRLWPCTNPSGFEIGTRENAEGLDVNRTFGRGGQSPEARAIVTVNRDRKFVLTVDLHEDDTCAGFYCYEYGLGGAGRVVAAAVREAGFPVEQEPVLWPDANSEADVIGGMSLTMLMARRSATRALTFETPVCLPLENRVAIHRIAVKAALGALANLAAHG